MSPLDFRDRSTIRAEFREELRKLTVTVADLKNDAIKVRDAFGGRAIPANFVKRLETILAKVIAAREFIN